MTKKSNTALASLFAVVFLLFSFFPAPAFALSLEEAKTQGLVGELSNGYLGVVSDSPEVQALVQDINAKRKVQYQTIAKRNGTPLDEVEQLAGKKAIEKTSSGNFIKVKQQWTRK